MNLSITNLCNRRCEYCFQKDWFLADSKEEIQEMDLDTIEKIFRWYKEEDLKILGGEPLLYSNLDGFFALAKKYNKKINVISNISIDPNKFKYIIDTYGNNVITSFLINTDFSKNQEKIFLTNLQYLIKNKKIDFSLSTTLLPNKEKILESQNRLIKILKNCKITQKYVGIRISPAEPYSQNYIPYNYTLDIFNIYLKLNRIRPNIYMYFDCPINACEIDFDFYQKKDANISFSAIKCCYDFPLDILPDKSAIWCSSSNFIKINNIFDYKDINQCINELKKQYNEYWKNNKILCNYQKCNKYGMCPGLCPAKNESMKYIKG